MTVTVAVMPSAWWNRQKNVYTPGVVGVTSTSLTGGQVGEIEAATQLSRNKPDKTECSYFSAGYQDSLGYYFQFVELAPIDASSVQEFCLDHFNDRET